MKFVNSRKGMTVVEIVVALAILGLVSVGFMGFFTDSFKFQARNQQTVTIQKIAEQTMETLKNNGGKDVTIGDSTLDLFGMSTGEEQVVSDNDYEYKVKLNSINNINNGTSFYDITVNVISKDNNSIVGTVNSTVQVNDDTSENTKKEKKYIRYYADDELIREEISYGGTYFITSYMPSKAGSVFIGWLYDDDYTYNAGDPINLDEIVLFDNEFRLEANWRTVTSPEESDTTYECICCGSDTDIEDGYCDYCYGVIHYCGKCRACCECTSGGGSSCICGLCISQGQSATCGATEWCDKCDTCNACATICDICGYCGACCKCYDNEPVTCACNGCTNASSILGYCESCFGLGNSDEFCTNGDCITHCDRNGCAAWWIICVCCDSSYCTECTGITLCGTCGEGYNCDVHTDNCVHSSVVESGTTSGSSTSGSSTSSGSTGGGGPITGGGVMDGIGNETEIKNY